MDITKTETPQEKIIREKKERELHNKKRVAVTFKLENQVKEKLYKLAAPGRLSMTSYLMNLIEREYLRVFENR